MTNSQPITRVGGGLTGRSLDSAVGGDLPLFLPTY
jgi:hypothetical protein